MPTDPTPSPEAIVEGGGELKGVDRLEYVIFQALTYEVSDTAYLTRLSRKAAKAVMADLNALAERAVAAALGPQDFDWEEST